MTIGEKMRRRNLKLVALFSVAWAGGFLYYFTSTSSNSSSSGPGGGVKVRPPPHLTTRGLHKNALQISRAGVISIRQTKGLH